MKDSRKISGAPLHARKLHDLSFKAIASVALLISGLAALPAFAADTPPAMIVPGQFNVGNTGAFTYTIPVAVPPGTAGMVPPLSLDYSSQGGDGLEGLGWTLSGLPSITRCPRTIAQDGVHGSVNYGADGTNNDRFCMEGQRLVLVSGTYGADGSQYRTEIEGFSEIIAHGSSGSGPSWFEVHTKAGQIMQFGHTTDSQAPLIPVSGSTTGPTGTVRAWAVNQIADTKGNYINIQYDGGAQDTTNGQVYPTQISYTGNTNVPQTPYNTVNFYYETRPDIVPVYQAGAMQQTTLLLTEIKTYAGLSVVYDYKLAYALASTNASHDELTSVTLCDTGGTNCLAPTTFGWQGSRDRLTTPGTSNSTFQASSNVVQLVPGYFLGDGLTDALPWEATSACGIYTNNGDGINFTYLSSPRYYYWFYEPPWEYQPRDVCKAPYGVQTLDLNADGLTDITVQTTDKTSGTLPQNARVFMINTGGGSFSGGGTITDQPQTNPWNWNRFGDFNGDGRTDVFINDTTAYVELSNGDGTFTNYGSYSGNGSLAQAIVPPDFDGDGCSDVLYLNIHSINFFCSPAVSTLSVPTAWTATNTVFADFNGDGKTDVLQTTSTGAKLYLSTGTGFAEYDLGSSTSTWDKYSIYVGDWNGDGKEDLLLVADGLSGHYPVSTSYPSLLFLSTGTGFIQAQSPGGTYVTLPNPGSSSDNPSGGTPGIQPVVADWNNDGAEDIWFEMPSGDVEYLNSYTPELMTTVSNGVGVTTTVTYDRLNKNGSVYTKCPGAPTSYVCGDTYPQQGLDGPLYAVTRIDSSNGLGACVPPSMTNCYSSSYSYGGAKAEVDGRGFLGFQTMTVTDLQTLVVQTTNYAVAFPQTGLILSQTKTVSSVTLSSTTNTYTDINLGTSIEGVTRWFVELSQSAVASNDLNGTTLPTVTTAYTYDCDTGSACAGTSPTGFGNVTEVVACTYTASSCTSGSPTKTTTNTYSNDTTNWYLGRLLTANVESVVGTSDITRHTSYTYDPSSGLLTSEIVEPGASDPTLTQETDYGYDTYGNKTSATVKACVWSGGICTTTSREIQTNYDSLGEFVVKNINALTQSETWAHNASFGLATSHTGPNGVVTTWSYDTFGRPSNEARADGTQTQITYAYCAGVNGGTASCPTYGAFLRQATPTASDGVTQIGPAIISYYDALSRPIGTDTQGFDGSWIRASTVYDPNGRVYETSRPFFVSGGTPQWTVNTYDALGRVTLLTLPNGALVCTAYSGLQTQVTSTPRVASCSDSSAQTTTTTKNAQGLVASVEDANSKTTSYVYDAEGDLLTITDPSGNVTTDTYDLRGRKLISADPDMGSWSYSYDGYGELASQTDAKSQTATLVYDALGRLIERVEPTFTSCWVYDAAANGIGKLYTASTTTGSTCSSGASYARTLNYDTFGRPIQTTLDVGGNVYVYQTSYDSDGRVATVSYPSAYIAKYVYTSLSYVSQIVDNASGTAYWTANARDAELHLTQATAGNGVVTNKSFYAAMGLVSTIQAGASNAVANFSYGFDLIGNLTTRADANEQVSESYCYDNLNRLQYSATGTSDAAPSTCMSSGTNIIDKTIGYDALGNISSKSDVGTYSYPTSGLGAIQPHAVTGIIGSYLGLTSPVLTYDANGNMTCVSSASGCSGTIARTATYTSFNMTASFTQSSTVLCLTYDSEHARIGQVATTTPNSCGSPGPSATTTTYVNDPASGSMEEAFLSGGTTAYRDYIKADGQIVAERMSSGGAPANWGAANWGSFDWTGPVTVIYFTLDHLGSIAVVTNASGAVVERDSYDTWGRRRNANGTDATSCTITSQTTRGFTNQEMIDSVCLVNLNARLYDPTLGRFMSADPVVGSVYVSQELNRFSYVLNNPLSLNDPTGLCFLGCFWKQSWFRDILAIAVVFAFQQWDVLPALLGETTAFATSAIGLVVNGGILGGIGGLIATGTFKGAALGMLEGALFAEAGNVLGNTNSGMTILGSHNLAIFVVHGFVGGLVSISGGQSFFSGFLAGGIGSLGPSPTFDQDWGETAEGTVEHAVLGGAGSVLGGGKFQNGAITGAFGYLLNAVNHMIVGSIIHAQIESQIIAASQSLAVYDLVAEYSQPGSRIADLFDLNSDSVYEIKPDTYESGSLYTQAQQQVQSIADSLLGHPGDVAGPLFEGQFTTAGYTVDYQGDIQNPYSGLIFYSIEDRSTLYSIIQNGLNQGWKPGSYSNPAPVPGLPPWVPAIP